MSKAESQFRVRFAPSPTGNLHVGNVRTALFNWLFVRKMGGRFILRIEDTDVERSRPEYESQIYEDLRWFGLDWDEGPDVGGEFGPYRQSGRLGIYRAYADRLLEQGQAYECFCTPEELEIGREAAREAGLTYTYSGKCRSLSKDQRQARLSRRDRHTVRFIVPSETVGWEDLVRGKVDWQAELLGDFVILKSDGWPVYNFAVVVDDILMRISHVIRGEGHVPNTPRQILLYQALQSPLPVFGHLSTILGPDGTKLSKRHGATSITEFQMEGYLPESLFNFLALLGWSPEGEKEILSREEMIEQFSFTRVIKAPAIFDLGKLTWMNRHYIRSIDAGRMAIMTAEHLEKAWRLEKSPVGDLRQRWLESVVSAITPRLDTLNQVVEETRIIFEYDLKNSEVAEEMNSVFADPVAMEIIKMAREIWQRAATQLEIKTIQGRILACEDMKPCGDVESASSHTEELSEALTQFEEALSKAYELMTAEVKQKTGRKGKALFHPIRLALTARPSGLELVKLIPIYELGSLLKFPILNVAERFRRFLEEAKPAQ